MFLELNEVEAPSELTSFILDATGHIIGSPFFLSARVSAVDEYFTRQDGVIGLVIFVKIAELL